MLNSKKYGKESLPFIFTLVNNVENEAIRTIPRYGKVQMGYCTLNKNRPFNANIHLIGCKMQYWNSQLFFQIIAINLRLLWLQLLCLLVLLYIFVWIRCWGSIFISICYAFCPRHFLRFAAICDGLVAAAPLYALVFAPLRCEFQSQQLIMKI